MPANALVLDKPYKNVDSSSLTANLEVIVNAYIDDLGGLNNRPSLKLFKDLVTNRRIDGVYYSDKNQCLIIVSDGRTFKISDQHGTMIELTGSTLKLDSPVTFSEGFKGATLYLFMTNGDGIHFTDFSANTQKLSGTSTPPLQGTLTLPTNITHIVNFHTYSVINDADSNSWYFSYVNDPFKFDASDSYDTEKSPDNNTAIVILNNRLLICGEQTIETFYNAGRLAGDPFERLKASYVTSGVASPSSIHVVDENTMYFLNKDRQIAKISGTNYEVISKPYDKEIQGLSSVVDASGFVLRFGGKQFYILNFAQAKKTLVYDIDENEDVFYEWGYWDEDNVSYENFLGETYAYAKKWNLHFTGSRKDGKLYVFDSEEFTDSGEIIRPKFLTGHINWGSDQTLKKSLGLSARLKRGVGKASDPNKVPYLLIRHRDNGKTAFSKWKKISLGKIGQTEGRRTLYTRGGQYHTRQYEVIMPDDAPFILRGIEEDVSAA